MTREPGEFRDYPFEECAKEASSLIKEGHEVYQKFTCDECGSRQTIDVPNTFYTAGTCEECKHTTNILAKGCNYMAIFNMGRKGGKVG